ncbi:hypothetical protein OESDEN_15986 [Oesophagostomum dentatum]|uniref:Uncharacterized protein n=1 Tax=Oesophagostomum dentatum TaxID=61180 RepID=A0A0B1SG48_OESDE|nr:hypothetical protein OESDEN_15986 [Oesophagostomum dentatum]
MTECLRSIDDSVQWLHNFERLQQLQTQVIWPSIVEMEPKSFVPDFLKVALSRQFCENLLAHPRRKLIHEGPLEEWQDRRLLCFPLQRHVRAVEDEEVRAQAEGGE